MVIWGCLILRNPHMAKWHRKLRRSPSMELYEIQTEQCAMPGTFRGQPSGSSNPPKIEHPAGFTMVSCVYCGNIINPKDRTWVYCVYTYITCRNLMMSCCLQCTYISLLIWGSISPCKLEKQPLLIWPDHALLFYLFQFQGCILHDNRHTTKTSQWFCLFGDLHRYCLGAMPWGWRWTNFCPGSIAGKLPDPLALASRGTSQALLLHHTSV